MKHWIRVGKTYLREIRTNKENSGGYNSKPTKLMAILVSNKPEGMTTHNTAASLALLLNGMEQGSIKKQNITIEVGEDETNNPISV